VISTCDLVTSVDQPPPPVGRWSAVGGRRSARSLLRTALRSNMLRNIPCASCCKACCEATCFATSFVTSFVTGFATSFTTQSKNSFCSKIINFVIVVLREKQDDQFSLVDFITFSEVSLAL
jgi:hypothetical protein